jgi:hypothetical protein
MQAGIIGKKEGRKIKWELIDEAIYEVKKRGFRLFFQTNPTLNNFLPHEKVKLLSILIQMINFPLFQIQQKNY